MPEPRPTDIDAGGIRLRLWEHLGGGPVVLCLHGYLDTGRSYDAFAREMDGAAQVVCLDWRGHGQSAWVGPGGSYHPWDHVKDLAWVLTGLRARGVEVACVVAHSMGGNVGLLLAGCWPSLVPRLLLVDAFGPPAEPQEDQPQRFGRMLKSMQVEKRFSCFDSREQAVDRMLETNYRLTREGAADMARYSVGPDPQDPGRYTFLFDPRLRGPTPLRFEESFWLALCGRVACPVTLLRAGHGYVPEGAVLDARAAAMPRLKIEVLPEDGHHLHVMRPKVVADQCRDLLRREARVEPSS